MTRDRNSHPEHKPGRRLGGNTAYLAGAAIGLAVAAGWVVMQAGRHPQRRYADHARERRSPLSLFTAGDHPRRRSIDKSGAHPLFERREEVYEAY